MADNYYQDPLGAPDYSAQGMPSLLSLSNLESLGRGSVAGLFDLPYVIEGMLRGDVDPRMPQRKRVVPSSEQVLATTPRMTQPTPQAGLLETAGAFMSPAPVAAVKPVAQAVGKGGKALGKAYLKEIDAAMMGERGGLLGAMTPQPKFAYLPTTPLKPNPLVGTRYQTEYVGNLAPRSPLNLEDYEGYSLLTFPSDITSRGQKVTGFSDILLDRPIITEGGFAFPRDIKNIEDLRAYASMLSAAQRQNNRVFKALEENKNLGGREKVLVAPHTMAYGAEDFSTMPTDALLALYETVGAKRDVVNEINKRIREATVKGEKGKFSEFVGLRDKGLREQLFTGEGLTKGSAGDLRKLFTEKMGSVYGEKAFGYNYPDLRRSLLDPNLVEVPKYNLGETFYEAMPELGLLSGAHSTYSHGMPGVYKGTLRSVPVKDVFADKYQQIYEQTKAAPKVAGQLAAGKNLDLDQLTMGALSSGETGTSLFLDAKTIKRLKKLMQD